VFLKALFSVLYFWHVYHPTQHSHLLTYTDTELFSHSILVTLTKVLPTFRLLCNRFPPGCLRIFLLSALLRLNVSLLVWNSNLDKSSVYTTHSLCNPGFIFDEHLTFSDQISSLSKSYSHIWELHCIRTYQYLDSKTPSHLSTTIFLKMIGKGFVLFKINSSPSAFYIIKPTCIVIGF